jgi:hypothetical protein
VGVNSTSGIGVWGHVNNAEGFGVVGENSGDGFGVWGHVANAEGSGVAGDNIGTGYGVSGSAAFGVGVFASSEEATALAAVGGNVGIRTESPNIALEVQGKAKFSRSGRVVVAGTVASPKSFVVVPNVELTASSLVLVTPQKTAPGVFVLGAVPNVSDSKVKIVLNKAVTGSYPVAWFVIERP